MNPQQPNTQSLYHIKHIAIDFEDHKITSNGIPISIDHKAIEVLQLLVEHAGETVHTDEFMASIWEDKPSSPEVVSCGHCQITKRV